jgi:hypothetical protein
VTLVQLVPTVQLVGMVSTVQLAQLVPTVMTVQQVQRDLFPQVSIQVVPQVITRCLQDLAELTHMWT